MGSVQTTDGSKSGVENDNLKHKDCSIFVMKTTQTRLATTFLQLQGVSHAGSIALVDRQ